MSAPPSSSPIPHMPDIEHTTPDAVVDGRRVFFVWHPGELAVYAPTIPRGALIEHGDQAGHRCIVWLPWSGGSATEDRWTLVSLYPLTVAEAFCCSRCGTRGIIRDGCWWVGAA